jgi:hypothetical protein
MTRRVARRSVPALAYGLLAAALVAVGVASGCARPAQGPGEPPIGLPTSGAAVVAEWSEEGGFVPPGWNEIRAPRLVVYADGTVIADANATITLTADEVTALVGELQRDLGGLPVVVHGGAENIVADASTTVLTVIRPDGELASVRAYALVIEGADYPDKLVAASRAMQKVWERASAGSPYQADGVRIVAYGSEHSGTNPKAWPKNVPAPQRVSAAGDFPLYEVKRADATAVLAAFPASVAASPGWHEATLPDGTKVLLAWRYLLPHE